MAEVRTGRFVPVRPGELADALEQDFFPAPAAARCFRDAVRLVEDLARHRSGVSLRAVDDLYAAYDPTAEVGRRPPPAGSPDGPALERFFERLSDLLHRAGFEAVSIDREDGPQAKASVPKELAIETGAEHAERLVVAVRGLGKKAIVIRPWHKLFRRIEVETPTHARVLVVLRMRGERVVPVRLYRDVAHGDLGLLLPSVRVRMRFLDKLKLSSSGGAAAISFVRLARLALLYATKFSLLQVLLLPLIVLVGGIYGGKTFFDYTKIRASYIHELARHLFELSIASDRAALARLTEMAAEEEAKVVLLAYAVLAAAGAEGRTPGELDDGVRSWMRARLGEELAFDAGGALARLEELGLVRPRVEGTRARVAVPVEEACVLLDQSWDDLYSPGGAITRPAMEGGEY